MGLFAATYNKTFTTLMMLCLVFMSCLYSVFISLGLGQGTY